MRTDLNIIYNLVQWTKFNRRGNDVCIWLNDSKKWKRTGEWFCYLIEAGDEWPSILKQTMKSFDRICKIFEFYDPFWRNIRLAVNFILLLNSFCADAKNKEPLKQFYDQSSTQNLSLRKHKNEKVFMKTHNSSFTARKHA